jgi:predicted Fe-Mo cluster-binding NifX family protein
MPRRRREEAEQVEVVEEEVREEKPRRPKSLKRRLSELIVRLIGEEAARHLINAEIEVFKAMRAIIDERIRSAERASERLQEIEVR